MMYRFLYFSLKSSLYWYSFCSSCSFRNRQGNRLLYQQAQHVIHRSRYVVKISELTKQNHQTNIFFQKNTVADPSNLD